MAMSVTEKMKKRFAGNMLTVGEMEEVVGGAMTGINQDAMLMKKLGLASLPAIGSEKAWEQAWGSIGVTAVKDKNGGSLYSVNGQSITQGEAWKMAKDAAAAKGPQGFTIPV